MRRKGWGFEIKNNLERSALENVVIGKASKDFKRSFVDSLFLWALLNICRRLLHFLFRDIILSAWAHYVNVAPTSHLCPLRGAHVLCFQNSCRDVSFFQGCPLSGELHQLWLPRGALLPHLHLPRLCVCQDRTITKNMDLFMNVSL